MKKLILWTFLLAGMAQYGYAQQHVSAIMHFKSFGIDKVEGADGTKATYKGATSLSGNLRIFDKNQFAFRAGIGVNNIEYQFTTDSLNTNYDAVRKNLTAYLGVEKYFSVGVLEPYIGVFVPINFNATNNITNIAGDASEQIKDGSVSAGFSITGGLNLKLFRFLRIGVGGDLGFSNFKEQVLDNLTTEPSAIKLKKLDVSPVFTVGLAF